MMRDLLCTLPICTMVAIFYALSLYSRSITDAIKRGELDTSDLDW